MNEINVPNYTAVDSISLDSDGNILVTTTDSSGVNTTSKLDTSSYVGNIGTLTHSDLSYDSNSVLVSDWVVKPGDYVKPINKEGEEKTKEVFLTIDPDITKKDTIGWKLAYWQEEFLNGNKGNVAVKVAFKAEDDAWLTPFGIFVEGSKWTGISIYVSPECDSSYLDDDQLLVNAILDILEANFKDEVNNNSGTWDNTWDNVVYPNPKTSWTSTSIDNVVGYVDPTIYGSCGPVTTASSYSITCDSSNNTYNVYAKG